MKLFLKVMAAIAATYAAFVAALFVAMLQPPDTFGRFMARLPGPAMRILPFPPLWMKARAGKLNIGSAAPDFDLETLDHSGRVRLSSQRGRPVVLIFGSYT